MEYKQVPDIISSKDLDYLSDAFNWHYGAYKNTIDAINNVTDKNLLKGLEKTAKTLYSIMNEILTILQEGLNENN